MLTFGKPVCLWLLLVVPVIILFYISHLKKKRGSAIRFSSLGIIKSAGGKSSRRMHVPFALMLLAVTTLIFALADPMIPLEQEKEGVNVVLVIDDSGSMAADDYRPTRLEAAKKSASVLIESLQANDNVGIVIFESGATTASYLTPFKDRALVKLGNIEQKEGMTAIGDGLSLAIDMALSIPNKRKTVILLSDGVNNAGAVSPEEASRFANNNNIQVHTIGLGSEEPVILGYDFFGRAQYAELDEETLKKIASETDGTYYKSVDSGTLEEIYSNIGENIEREEEPTSIKDCLVIFALGVLLLNIYIIYGRYRIVV